MGGDPADSELLDAIDAFLQTADLNVVSSKGIRKHLEAKFCCKLKPRKEFIQKAALDIIERIERERSKTDEADDGDEKEDSEDEDDEPIAPRKRKKVSEAKKNEAVTTFMENGVFYSRTGRPQRHSQAKKQIAAQKRRSRKRTSSEDKQNGTKKKRKNGFKKEMVVTSESLAKFLGKDRMTRQEAHKYIWDYLKEKCEVNEKDKRERLLNDVLISIFKVKKLTYFSLNKHLSKYMKDPDLIGM